MVKAKREIKENIALVDIALILLDARAPYSCRNSELEKIASKKPIIFILNKIDLVSKQDKKRYLEKFSKESSYVVAVDSINGKGSKDVVQMVQEAFKANRLEMLRKGRRVRSARLMIAGVPNVGKSTFINMMAGKKVARTGAKPGITRGRQWVRIREDIEFIDTPGLMWPRIESEEQGLKLALINILGEKSYDENEVAIFLIQFLKEKYPEVLEKKYNINQIEDQTPYDILEKISRKRGHLLKGDITDTDKTAKILLQEFRKGMLGQIALE